MTTAYRHRSPGYHTDQIKTLTRVRTIIDRAFKKDLPEITWNIGLSGAFGRCDSLETLQAYGDALDRTVQEHARHWTVDLGSNVHLRFDPA